MKRLILTVAIALTTLFCSAQKKDSTVSVLIVMDTTSFKQAIELINNNVDSKSVSNWLVGILTKGAQLIKLPADKPRN